MKDHLGDYLAANHKTLFGCLMVMLFLLKTGIVVLPTRESIETGMLYLSVIIAVMAVLAFIWWHNETKRTTPYTSKIGLLFLHQIEDFQVKKDYFGSNEEFEHVLSMFKNWSRERKYFINFVNSTIEKELLLKDIYYLEERAKKEMEEDERRPIESKRFLEKTREKPEYKLIRKGFTEEWANVQIGQLQAWEPPIEDKANSRLDSFNGSCLLTRRDDKVEKLIITLDETGAYSFAWYENYGVAGECERFPDQTIMGKTKIPIVFSSPKNTGAFYIFNQDDDRVEKIPLS